MENMVKGYRISTLEMCTEDQTNEQLFAVYEDGSVVTTGVIQYTSYFDKKGREWHQVDALPEDAEYIGTFHRPVNVKEAAR